MKDDIECRECSTHQRIDELEKENKLLEDAITQIIYEDVEGMSMPDALCIQCECKLLRKKDELEAKLSKWKDRVREIQNEKYRMVINTGKQIIKLKDELAQAKKFTLCRDCIFNCKLNGYRISTYGCLGGTEREVEG